MNTDTPTSGVFRAPEPHKDLVNTYGYHAPSPRVAQVHELVRVAVRTAAMQLRDLVPSSYERTQAEIHLREAMFWGNAAVALHPAAAEEIAAREGVQG